jgi:hypothetical protein
MIGVIMRWQPAMLWKTAPPVWPEGKHAAPYPPEN